MENENESYFDLSFSGDSDVIGLDSLDFYFDLQDIWSLD